MSHFFFHQELQLVFWVPTFVSYLYVGVVHLRLEFCQKMVTKAQICWTRRIFDVFLTKVNHHHFTKWIHFPWNVWIHCLDVFKVIVYRFYHGKSPIKTHQTNHLGDFVVLFPSIFYMQNPRWSWQRVKIHCKIFGWKRNFLLGMTYFQGRSLLVSRKGSQQKLAGSSWWDWKTFFFLMLFGGSCFRAKRTGKLQGCITLRYYHYIESRIHHHLLTQKNCIKNTWSGRIWMLFCVSGSGGLYWENYFQSEANWNNPEFLGSKNFAADVRGRLIYGWL